MQRRRWIDALVGAVVVGLAPAVLSAQSLVSRGFLAGEGQPTTGRPVDRPYFVGWDAEVTPPERLGRTSQETGGVAIDGRTGWVYVVTRDGRALCVENGRIRWSVERGGQPRAAPTLYEESLIVGTSEGVLEVLNSVTGQRRVRALLGEELVTQPLVVAREGAPVRVLVGSAGDSLFAVDMALGQKLWRVHRDQPAPFVVHGFARPVVAGDRVLVGFADGVVEARSLSDGRQLWERSLVPADRPPLQRPADGLVDVDGLATDGRRLYAAGYGSGVVALELETGAEAWLAPLPAAGRVRLQGGRLYAQSPGLLTALRATDGKALWRFSFGDRAASLPVMAGGMVLLAEDDGPLYFLDALTGSPLGLFNTGAGFASSPAVVGDRLVALSNGGRVYALTLVR